MFPIFKGAPGNYHNNLLHTSHIAETLAKPGRGNVLVARAAANRGQRGRCPSHARGFASASAISEMKDCAHPTKSPCILQPSALSGRIIASACSSIDTDTFPSYSLLGRELALTSELNGTNKRFPHKTSRGEAEQLPSTLSVPHGNRIQSLEIAVQKAFKACAMAGFILGHFMDSIMDGVVAEFLGTLCDHQFALAGALFGICAHLDVLLRIGRDDLTEKLGKLCGMLCLFECITLESLSDFRISVALRLTAHGKVPSDFGALAHEVVLKSLHDLGIFDLACADFVLASPDLLSGGHFLNFELGPQGTALRALLGSGIAFMDIAANGAYISLHRFSPFA